MTRAGPHQALGPADFKIEPGEFVSIIGASGCGKSTLMLITAGLIPATSGSILVGGQTLDRPLTDIGIVFQDHLLLDFRTAMDNVMLQQQIRRLHRARAEQRAAIFSTARSGGASIAIQASSPAACGSASRSPGRWCMSRR